MEHLHYVQKLEAFLRTNYPQCIPIPSLNNMKPTSPKKPAWAFRASIPAEELWARWERDGRHNCSEGILLTLRSGLIVVDIDCKEVAAALERSIPSMLDTLTPSTMHCPPLPAARPL